MFGAQRLSLALVATLGLAGGAVACSSDDSAAPKYAPFDSGTVFVPEAGPFESTSVQIQVQGQGVIESADVHMADGGLVGQVICSQSSTACTAQRPTTLYALPANGWVPTGWTTTGMDAGFSLGGATNTYEVDNTTPSPLIVVFTQFGSGGSSSTSPPSDAGVDGNL